MNQLDGLAGRRSGMDAVFGLRHLAHAPDRLTGDWLGGVRADEIKKSWV